MCYISFIIFAKLTLIGLLVTALPCRLQNDSPPNSISENSYNNCNQSLSKIICNNNNSHAINENNNSINFEKLLPDIANNIDESNYVNLNSIASKYKLISTELARPDCVAEKHLKSTLDMSTTPNGVHKRQINVEIDNRASKLKTLYPQMNSTGTNTIGNITNQSLLIINQKNVISISNNNYCNSNGIKISNASNNTSANSVDCNQNALLTVANTFDTSITQSTQCMNKLSNPMQQAYVIHNGNHLKEMAKSDISMGKHFRFAIVLTESFVPLFLCIYFCFDIF